MRITPTRFITSDAGGFRATNKQIAIANRKTFPAFLRARMSPAV
jgi:hypothetical protein